MLSKDVAVLTVLMENRDVTRLFLMCSLFCQLLNSDATGRCSDYFNGRGQPYICPKRECTDSAHRVWGTGSYTYDSSICRAAWHDGRILPWSDNQRDRTVTWSSQFKLHKYYRTRRYGFTTRGYGSCAGYNFTSARVKEPLYNISVLVSLSDGDVRVYGGSNVHIGTDAIESGVHVNIWSRGATSAPASKGNVGTGPNAYSRFTLEDKFAAYYFTVDKKNLYSWVIVPGVTFSTGDCKEDEKGHNYRGRINTTLGGIICQRWDSQTPHTHGITGERFKENYCRNKQAWPETRQPWCYTTSGRRWDYCSVPVCTQEHLTQRTSVGAANVKFKYKGSESGLSWKKDGGDFTWRYSSIWNGQQTPSINTVELGHSGIYMVYTQQGYRRVAKGVFRLIVRVCPDGKYGGLCEHNCPTCSNGGVCHDITGECICAPGFKGRHCSEACGPNRFGYDCALHCSDDVDTGCRYRQVCTIDPYGCSCATGFKGIGCDQECPDNFYGADCLQSCGRCLPGTCDRFRGICTCQEGYKTPYCKIDIARLVNAPSISRSRTVITVTWRLWSAQTDSGVGPVHKYIVEYRQTTASDWTRSNDVDSGVSSFSIRPGDDQNQYQMHVRVKIKLANNDVGAASPESSVCGLPRLPIVTLIPKSTAIRVSWNEPDWRCDSAGTYTLHYKSKNSDWASEANIPSSTLKRVFSTLVCTEWTFKIQAHNKDLNSDVSQESSVTSLEKEANKVETLTSSSIAHDTISLTWAAPINNGCPVKTYIIQCRLINVLACGMADQPSEDRRTENTTELTTSLVNLRPYSRYEISLRARTGILDGEEEKITKDTLSYLPSEPPTSVRIAERSDNTLEFIWERPTCLSSNGPTDNFDYQLKRETSLCLSEEFVNDSTNGLSKKFGSLQPHATYSFRVRAVNGKLAGPWSNWMRNVTNESAPPSPKNLSVIDMNATSVIIGWTPPCPPNGVIREYQLNHQSVNETDDNNRTTCTDCSSLKLLNLKIKNTYEFKIRAKTTHWGSWSSSIYETVEEGAKNFKQGRVTTIGGACGGVAAFLLVLALAVFIVRRRRHQSANKGASSDLHLDNIEAESEESSNGFENAYVNAEPMNGSPQASNPLVSDPVYEDFNKSIKVEDLVWYVGCAFNNDIVVKEYESLPSNHIFPHTEGSKEENKKKNRFKNILAYDKNRVALELLPHDINSGYVNASYIDGYNRPKAFIAAMGPNRNTVEDFWRMIWQEQITRIVMLTKNVEDGKRKCEVYWPEETQFEKYGDVRVTAVDKEKGTDFTIRKFEVTKDNCEQQRLNTSQYHFTSWPDHGVPSSSSALWKFYRTVKDQIRADNDGVPTVVHCSAGVGRTGTFIMMDILSDQADAEAAVDVLGQLGQLRQQRVNMVQTLDQYKFIYTAMVEKLHTGDTFIPTAEFRFRLQEIISSKTTLKEELKTLNRLCLAADAEEYAAGKLKENSSKNRDPNILPLGICRPFLMTAADDGGNDYINAVFVNGYNQRDAFIVTQSPLPNTVCDFWKMVHDHDCQVIVMLSDANHNDDTCPQYWPDEESVRFGRYQVECVGSRYHHGDVIKQRTLVLTDTRRRNSKGREIKHFQLRGWPNKLAVPPSNLQSALIELIEIVELAQQQTGKNAAVIHCLDGCTRSGYYCTLANLFEKIKVDQGVDVFQTVKNIRATRFQFITSGAQYNSLYSMAEQFIQSFDTYANFS